MIKKLLKGTKDFRKKQKFLIIRVMFRFNRHLTRLKLRVVFLVSSTECLNLVEKNWDSRS